MLFTQSYPQLTMDLGQFSVRSLELNMKTAGMRVMGNLSPLDIWHNV